MKGIVVALTALAMAGCATSGYQKFYQSYGDVSQLQDVTFLSEGEEPIVYQVDIQEMASSVKSLRARDYVAIGSSSFNGVYEDISRAKAHAKKLKAVVVIVGAAYTETQTSTVPISMPSTQTTYGSGSVYAGGMYGTYTGSSTTYGSTVVPVTVHHRRYDQGAVYFVKGHRKYRFGIQLADLTPQHRQALGRNTGALIDVVVEKTPAFYANVMEGDVIIAIDGREIRDPAEAISVMASIPEDVESSVLKVIRGGVEIDVDVKF